MEVIHNNNNNNNTKKDVGEDESGKISFHEVQDMLQRGEKPTDIRLVDDKPPNPDAVIPKGTKTPPQKPWMKSKTATIPPQDLPTIIPQSLPIFVVDAFTTKAFSGNPAAICLSFNALPEETMVNISKEMNLSETAFVVPIGGGSFKTTKKFNLRWFTSAGIEVPLCGHATLATSHVLFSEIKCKQSHVIYDTLSGELIVHKEGTGLRMDFPQGIPGVVSLEEPFKENILNKMSIPNDEVQSIHFCPKTKKLLIEVNSGITRILALKPDFVGLLSLSPPKDIPVRGVIVTTQENTTGDTFENERAKKIAKEKYDFVSRYFAPWVGINEDPVTGSAHTVLAVYWASKLKKDHLRALQASERGGEINIIIEGDRVSLLGTAITVLGGKIKTH